MEDTAQRYINDDAPMPFGFGMMRISGGYPAFRFLGRTETRDIPSLNGREPALHRHTHYEMVLVRSGTLTQHMENGTVRYNAGDACLLDRNTRHCEGSETDCELVFLCMAPEFLRGLFRANDIMPGRAQFRAGEIRKFVLDGESAGYAKEYLDFFCTGDETARSGIFRILDEMASLLTENGVGFAFRVKALLLELFAALEDEKCYRTARMSLGSGPEEFIMDRMLRYMEQRRGQVSRAELENAMHYDGGYLSSIAKRRTGMTVTQLARWVRMEEAKRLLMKTDMSVSEIVKRLGMENRTYFYKTFAQHTGMSPAQFRSQSAGTKDDE